MMNQPLNERLREERKRKGLTQEQLAGLISVSRQTISHWETGRAAPDYDSLRLLAEALDITSSQLLGEEAPPEKTEAPSEPELVVPAQPPKRTVPRSFWWIGAAVLAFCLAASGWLLLRPSEPAKPLITPDYFAVSSPRVEGKAWLDIVLYELPVPRSPTKSSSLYQWFYSMFMREENGVDFTIDLYESWCFFADGNVSYGVMTGTDIPWIHGLTSTIYAGGSREFGVGESSHTPILGVGVQITGTDAFGNELFFRKYIPYSMEIKQP